MTSRRKGHPYNLKNIFGCHIGHYKFVPLLLTTFLIWTACAPENHEERDFIECDFAMLPHSTTDSILISHFFSSSDSGYTNQVNNLDKIKSDLITSDRDYERLRLEIMASCIEVTRQSDLISALPRLQKAMKAEEHLYSKPLASLLFYVMGTYIRYQDRLIESVALGHLALSLGESYPILAANANSLIAASLLTDGKYQTARLYFEDALEQLPTSNSERKSLLLGNLGFNYYLLDSTDKAIDLMNQALIECPSSDIERQFYLKSKLAIIYAEEDIQLGLNYIDQEIENMLSQDPRVSIENQLLKGDLLLEIAPDQALIIFKSVIDSIAQSSDFYHNLFSVQVEAHRGMTHAINNKTYANKKTHYDHIDSLITFQFSKLDEYTQMHYLEYTQELIAERINLLVDCIEQTSCIQEIIRLIEWDHQIDMELFQEPKNSFNPIYSDSVLHSILISLNELNFVKTDKSTSQWLKLSNHLLKEFKLSQKVNTKIELKSVSNFSDIENRLDKLDDSTSVIMSFPLSNEHLIIGMDRNKIYYTLSAREHIDSVLTNNKQFIEGGHLDSITTFDIWDEKFNNQLHDNIMISLSSDLETFPFECVSDGGNKLGRTRNLSYCFSLLNSSLGDENIKMKTISAFAFTDVKDLNLDLEYSELPGTYYEVKALKEKYPQTTTYYGKDVNLFNLKKAFLTSDVVYISTHSDFIEHNRLSHFLTGKSEEGLDSINLFHSLRGQDIADVVVLSACQTASGTSTPTYGHHSLVKWLKKCGAKVVIGNVGTVLDSKFDQRINFLDTRSFRGNVYY